MINPEIKQARRRNWKVSTLERDTRLRSNNKSRYRKLHGLPRKYLFEINGFQIYEVDGEWIRNNVYAWFRIGGHGRVHLFIPNDEIWIEEKHGTYEYMARTIIHEINEYKKMKKLPFYHAHLNSLKMEFTHPKKLKWITNLLRNKTEEKS